MNKGHQEDGGVAPVVFQPGSRLFLTQLSPALTFQDTPPVGMPDKMQDTQLHLNFRYTANNFLV